MVNKYNPRSCQGNGGVYQRSFCLKARNNATNFGNWQAISPAKCNSTVYTQNPGHQEPWIKNSSALAGPHMDRRLVASALTVLVGVALL